MNRDGVLHILVNNAGGVRGQVHHHIEEVRDEDFDAIIQTNLHGAFYGIRAVAPIMKRKGYGRIINISSGARLWHSLTGIQSYTSAKAGQIGLTRQMVFELGPYGITVNNVAPGFVISNPSTEKQWEAMGAEGQAHLVQSIPLRRLGKSEDIAGMVAFFASEDGAYVTGQVISVDGGLTLSCIKFGHYRGGSVVNDAIVVVGAGAIGGAVAAYLVRQGLSIVLVDANLAYVQAINERGLTIHAYNEEFTVKLKADTPDSFNGFLNRVFLATKALHTGQAMDWITPRLSPSGYVVSMQNGLNERLIADRVGPGL